MTQAAEPEYFTFSAGVYDINDDKTAGDFRAEYRSDIRIWKMVPFVGLMGSTDNAVYAYAGLGQTSLLQFRLVNVIDSVDTTDTSNMMIGDSMKLHSFGQDLADSPKFNNWIYNIFWMKNIFNN